jgi:hypothetical protein
MHAGSGTGTAFVYLGLIPGFIPSVALTIAVGVVLVLPVLFLGLAAGLIAAPPYAGWRLATRHRRNGGHRDC